MQQFKKSFIIIFTLMIPILGITGGVVWFAEVDDVDSNDYTVQLNKPSGVADEAVGILDKGQLQNLTMNYGQITDTRYEDVGNAPTQYFYDFRYPRKDYTGLCDDFSLFFALPENTKNGNNGNVIDGWTDNDNEDWIAKDGSYGETHYNAATDPTPHEELKYPLDNPTTPFLAHSDLQFTWPVDDNGTPFWPGYFRRDRITGDEIEGEFASDRDVYAVFDDSHNVLGNPIGIEVEMMAYSYGRPYADKFQFYEFFIHNKSGRQLDSCWVGYYKDPDCSDHGEEILILPDPTFSDPNIPDIILDRDIDGDIGGATRPNSRGITEDYSFGMAVLETPKDIGVTTFHYYQDAGPTDDKYLWPIITNNPTDPDVAPFASQYFHGTNVNIDDVNLIYNEAKQDLVFIVASGPFSMQPDEVVKSTVVVAVGEDDADFYAQIDQAVQMFDFKFVGPSAPPAPSLSAVPKDGQITLYWDAVSETKPDPFTGDIDFEGYRIYRSEDKGQTWGTEILDSQGNLIGYLPIAQFDLDNDISGPDQRNPFTFLGSNTGLKHTFIDNLVKNGITYAYTIVAYDKGDSLIYSLESARGTSTAEHNFVVVTPRPEFSGKIPAEINSLIQTGNGKGGVNISVFDDQILTDNDYEIHFKGEPADVFNLYNVTTAETLLFNLPINFEDNPVIDGFQVGISSEEEIGGIQSVTDGFGLDVLSSNNGQDSSKSWTVSITPYNFPANIEVRTFDYEVRFTSAGSMAYSWSPFSSTAAFPVNFEVWNITDTNNPQQISFQVKDDNANQNWDEGESINIVNVPYSNPTVGDSLISEFPDNYPYTLIITNSAEDTLNVPPQEGDIINIQSFRSFSINDNILFNFNASKFDPDKVDLSEIRVVPNPYIVGAEWEELQNVHQIHFMFLPPICDINIYTISGEKVKTIRHTNYTGDDIWNLTNQSNQAVSFGVYVYVVSTPQGEKHIGKFAIIR